MARTEFDLAHEAKLVKTEQLQRELRELYAKLAKDFAKRVKRRQRYTSLKSQQKTEYIRQYQRALEREIQELDRALADRITDGAYDMAETVIEANVEFMGRHGLDIKGGFHFVPTEVISSLLQGGIYKNDWKFSEAIWGNSKKINQDISRVVAEGLAANKSVVEIAADLEKYVNPAAKKDWNWSKVYPGTSKKVDYNAQRMARTMMQHAYQLSMRRTIAKNPFVTGVIWHSAFRPGRTCAICEARDGLIYAKGKEPLDHPNGLCWLEPALAPDEAIDDALVAWVNGESNPALEAYMRDAFPEDYQRLNLSEPKRQAQVEVPIPKKYK